MAENTRVRNIEELKVVIKETATATPMQQRTLVADLESGSTTVRQLDDELEQLLDWLVVGCNVKMQDIITDIKCQIDERGNVRIGVPRRSALRLARRASCEPTTGRVTAVLFRQPGATKAAVI